MNTSTSKLLVLGIDAANPMLLRRWAKEGSLPNIRAMLQRGLIGDTSSVEGFYVGSTWPSFYTGVTPAKHGFHYLIQLRSGTYDCYRPADEGIVKREPFWSQLSRAGQRVAILDVPLTKVEPSLNGIQTVEWGAHDAVYGFQASPPDLQQTIKSRFGVHPLGPSCDGIRKSPQDYQRFVDTLLEGTRVKAELTKHFLRQGGWDFFMQVFTESHCVGHQCWHLHDSTHPAHVAATVAKIGDPLRRVYENIDHAIGEIIREAGDALVVLLVAHGMSYWYGANFLLPEILRRLGVTQPLAEPPGLGHLRRAWRCVPTNVRNPVRVIRRWLHRAAAETRLPKIRFDPGSSACFPHSNGQPISGIRLNLMGREPAGILRAVDVASFSDQLAEDLLGIVDQRTGEPLVREVLRTADLDAGEFMEDLPDLLIAWSDAVPTGCAQIASGAAATVRASSPKIGVVTGVNSYCRTGEHRPEGMFVAVGPSVRPGVMTRRASILDFAPTFAAFLGVELRGCDGTVLNEML